MTKTFVAVDLKNDKGWNLTISVDVPFCHVGHENAATLEALRRANNGSSEHFSYGPWRVINSRFST